MEKGEKKELRSNHTYFTRIVQAAAKTASPRNYVRSRSTPQSPHSPQLLAVVGRGGGAGGGAGGGTGGGGAVGAIYTPPPRATASTSASCPLLQPRHHQSEQQLNKRRCIYASTGSAANIMMDRESLSEWAKDKPLSILQLDPADRAVLRIAGESLSLYKII